MLKHTPHSIYQDVEKMPSFACIVRRRLLGVVASKKKVNLGPQIGTIVA